MKIHRKYMERCVEIGKNALGSAAPNPMVGCVIVYENKIIGEGFTSEYGGNHAEVNAINSVEDKSLLDKASLYVTLEPCAHYGKTPPCTDLILKYKIPRVFIGTTDCNALVKGRGIEMLKEGGCIVEVGLLKTKCRKHHKRFFTFHEKHRPYIILKWAQTMDGFLAPELKNNRLPVWISNPYSRQLVHKWRSEEQSILVGTNTVIEDNPSLTSRDWMGKNPLRIVIDRNRRLDIENKVFDLTAETIIISARDSPPVHNLNSNIKIHHVDWEENMAQQICSLLYQNNINSVIIEGGSVTLSTFIKENLWDEARVFTGSISLKNGIPTPQINGKTILQTTILTDILTVMVND